ncbi:MAG: superinfection immunity protein [Halanaerobiales bacterium]|nr:superinfection immunity protein [Halanaerobiales bacterium]
MIDVIFLILMVFLLYFIPLIIASCRNCKHSDGIWVLNIFLGWTFIGWVIALIWSVGDEPED